MRTTALLVENEIIRLQKQFSKKYILQIETQLRLLFRLFHDGNSDFEIHVDFSIQSIPTAHKQSMQKFSA